METDLITSNLSPLYIKIIIAKKKIIMHEMMKVMNQGRRLCNKQLDKDSSAQLFNSAFQISEIGAKF